ncbi:MAG: hypothetical protein QF876_13325 [Desulfobacterales bacterium]|nr:hypothetical protein [Desulfobacter sp.]MDP6683937.1 hypothetical protein [Desulfobacterales bacterium]MDP6808650.1 hypothetical protein [Desulfobacterales bacterium]
MDKRLVRTLILAALPLALMFNGIGIPVAATGLIYPTWTMAAMAVSVTAPLAEETRARAKVGEICPLPRTRPVLNTSNIKRQAVFFMNASRQSCARIWAAIAARDSTIDRNSLFKIG